MGTIEVWEVESCTECEVARGRSPQTRILARHPDAASGAGVLPAEGLHRFCDLAWFPRFVRGGEGRETYRIFQVRGVAGIGDGFYGASPPGPDVKVAFNRWFVEPA